MGQFLGDVCVKTGVYQDAGGKEKGRYMKVGAAFTDDQGRVSILLQAVPLVNFGKDGGVWLSVFTDQSQDQQPQPQQQQPQQQQRPAQQQQPQQRGWGRR